MGKCLPSTSTSVRLMCQIFGQIECVAVQCKLVKSKVDVEIRLNNFIIHIQQAATDSMSRVIIIEMSEFE